MNHLNAAIEAMSSDVEVQIDPTVVPVVRTADEVHFRAGPWSGPILTLHDESRDATLATVVEQFDGGASIDDVIATVDGVEESSIRHVLSELDGKNMLARGNDDLERDRSPLPLRFSRDDLECLSSKSVLVVSSGTVGPAVVAMLTDAGIEDVYVRHRSDDGTSGKYDSATTVTAWGEDRGSVSELVENVDLVLTATERPWRAAATRLNTLAVDAGTPLVHAEVAGYDITVGPTVLPGETACYECYRHHRNTNLPAGGGYTAFEHKAGDRAGGVATRLPFSQITAGFLVTDVINLLCYGHGYTVGSVVTFDMSDLSTESNDVLHLPRCETCSELADTVGRDALFTVSDLVER